MIGNASGLLVVVVGKLEAGRPRRRLCVGLERQGREEAGAMWWAGG